jgi:hypothetical protein
VQQPVNADNALPAIEAAGPGMARPVDAGGMPGESGEGNRRRRDRRRRGDRGDRPERTAPRESAPGAEEAGTLIAAPVHAGPSEALRSGPAPTPPMREAAIAVSAAEMVPATPPMRPIEPITATAPVRAAEPSPAAEPARASEPPPATEPPRQWEPVERAPAAPPAAAPAPRPPELPKPQPVAIPPIALTLPPDSNLELVETRSRSVPVPEAEPEQPAGPRRVRPPRVEIAEEPLQIVETRKDDRPPPG